jgi:hypothetical protein
MNGQRPFVNQRLWLSFISLKGWNKTPQILCHPLRVIGRLHQADFFDMAGFQPEETFIQTENFPRAGLFFCGR